MKRNNIFKAIVVIAVALAFVMPGSAAFANVGTIGVISNSENTGDMEKIVEISTNSDEVITSDTSDSIEVDSVDSTEGYTDIPIITSDNINVDIARDPYGQYMYYDDGEDSGWYYESGMAEWPEWDTEMAAVVDTATYVDSGNTEVLPTTGDIIYVDDDADPSWYNETQVKTITEGITNVTVGGTVYVYNGTYYEKVTVNKQLDLIGIGGSRENVIVDWSNPKERYGVLVITANNVNVDGFTVTNGTTGIFVSTGVSYSSISNCNLCDNDKGKGMGFFASDAPNTNVTNCDVYNNVAYGIGFGGRVGSSNSNIVDCNVYDNGANGLMLLPCPSISVINCNVYRNDYTGMYVSMSEDSIITDNEVYENGRDGMVILYSSGVGESNYYLRNNVIHDVSSGYAGLVVLGSVVDPRTWHNDIDTSNTIDGKPVYYLSQRVNEMFDFASIDVGYLAIVDCTNVVVKNTVVSGCADGILIAGETNGSLITGCTFSGNHNGVWIYAGSYNNEITNCNIFNNVWGVRSQETYPGDGEDNVIKNCNIYNNSEFGFWTQCTSHNSIIGCDIYGNGFAYTQAITGQSWWPGSLQNGGPGVMIHYRTTDNTVENCTVHGNYEGIFVFDESCTGQTFRNNEVYDNTDYGPNKCKASGHGLCISEGNAVVDNCNSHDNRYGIYIGDAGTSMKNCVMNDNTYNFGLGAYDSMDIDTSNTINGKPMWYLIGQSDLVFDETYNLGWLWLDSCTNITVENLDIEGILLTYTTDSTISGVTAHSSTRGIYLFYSSNNTVVNCEAYNNAERGIALYYSDDCSVTECTVHDNAVARIYSFPAGLYFSACENIVLEDCEVYNHYPDFTTGYHIEQTGYGVYFRASNSIINNNVLHDNTYDLYVAYCSNNIVTNNTMVKGIIVEGGTKPETWLHTIDTTNTAGGKPVYYYKNQVGGSVPPGSGQVILVNCTQMTVEDQSWSDVSIGLLLGFSTYNTIRNCEAHNNLYGFYINWCRPAGYNTIEGCTAYDNERDGIWLRYSGYNNVTDCEFYGNGIGIHLWASSTQYNLLRDNTVHDNEWGIYIGSASYRNTVFHNNIANNDYNAFDDAQSVPNSWDDGYPSGGNFWDDYTGVDEYSGPDQNIPGSDGIGDTPYVIEGGPYSWVNQDNYPFMEPLLKTPELLLPADGTGTEDLTPTFDWTDIKPLYPVTYTLLVANDTGFSNIIIEETGLTESEYTPTEDMPADITYYWKVNASVGIYDTDWSETWSVYIGTDRTPPTTPDLIYPTDELTTVELMIFFDWTDAYDAFGIDYYTLQVATDDAFDNIVAEETPADSECALALATDDDDYYWRIQAVDNNALLSDWSETWMFTRLVDTTPPTVELTYPVGGEDLRGTVEITWTATDDYTSELLIDIDYRCGGDWQVMSSGEENDGTYTWDTTLYPDSEYYVIRVSTSDKWDNAGFAESYPSITVDNTAPVTTVDIYPSYPDGENNWYISNVHVVLLATDEPGMLFATGEPFGFGVDYTMYRINEGDWQEYTGPFTVDDDDEYTLEFYSVDYAGNKEEAKSIGFKIDQTAPTINLTVEKTDSTWLLTADVSDETSGVAKVEFYLDGELLGNVTESPYTWEVSEEGTAYAVVYDNAGNEAISDPVPVSYSQSQSQSSSNSVPVRISGIWLGGLTGIQNIQRRV